MQHPIIHRIHYTSLSSTKSEHVAENKATFSQSFVDILWEPYKLCITNVHDVQLADRSTLH